MMRVQSLSVRKAAARSPAWVGLALALLAAGAGSGQILQLGPPPEAPAGPARATTHAPRRAQASLVVTPATREASRQFYFQNFREDTPAPVWSGNLAACVPGSMPADFLESTRRQINYYRAMSGMPADISFDPNKTYYCQQAALMMVRNKQLSHSPTPDWLCYTVEGSNAAHNSNLVMSYGASWIGWRGISEQMREPGDINYYVGHRRWLLYPQTEVMGEGDIPERAPSPAAQVTWVIDYDHYGDPRPACRDDFVAWPPPGYVPYQTVFPRWSLSLPDGRFADAVITMVDQNGQALPVKKEEVLNGYGENTLVWIPNNMSEDDHWPRPRADTPYHVTIANVTVNGTNRLFQYTVTVYDPAYTLTIAPTAATFQAAGGTGVISVASSTNYGWTAYSLDTWITVTAGQTGTGMGTVRYTVAANPVPTPRRGVISAAGAHFVIDQEGTDDAAWLLPLIPALKKPKR